MKISFDSLCNRLRFPLLIAIQLSFFQCSQDRVLNEDIWAISNDNKSEVEKVIGYFRDKDPQKLEAAYFLIENMQYHRSLYNSNISPEFPQYFRSTDSIYRQLFKGMQPVEIVKYKPKNSNIERLRLADRFNEISETQKQENSKTDLESFSAAQLINHINHAFEMWRKSPYLKNIEFKDFKEFVLPYRATNEELTFDSQFISSLWSKVLIDTSDSECNVMLPLSNFQAFVSKARWLNHFTKPLSRSGMYDLILPKFKMDCHNMTNWSIRVLRSCGIPVVYEYTPQWTDRNSRHFWCVSPDRNGILQPFTAPDNNLRDDWESDIKYCGKVYRKTFGVNFDTPYFVANEKEQIPEELSSPFLSDQTARYHITAELNLPISSKLENKVVYLCMFKGNKLNPVGWGIFDRKEGYARFSQVPLNTIFVIAYCDDDEEIIPLTAPFFLKGNNKELRLPEPLTHNRTKDAIKLIVKKDNKLYEKGILWDSNSKIEYIKLSPCKDEYEDFMQLTCKYPEKRRLAQKRKKLINAYFLGGNEEKGKYDTLLTLTNSPSPHLQEVFLNNQKSYRFYKFRTADSGPTNIAEMEFLGKNNFYLKTSTPTPLYATSPGQEIKKSNLVKFEGKALKTGSSPENAFDGDFETYVGSSVLGVDFSRSVNVTHVRFSPRTANNIILPGHSYRLLYHNGRQWQEHSTQVASQHYLLFKSVPKGTIYWLQNLTEGKEELPFLYKDGVQKFIHIL